MVPSQNMLQAGTIQDGVQHGGTWEKQTYLS